MLLLTLTAGNKAFPQSGGEALNIPITVTTCFGLNSIADERAWNICEALAANQKVRARELSEAWVELEPDSPGAQYSLAEVLLEVEGNMPRAVYHLNRVEELTGYESMQQARESGNLEWHYLALHQLGDVYLLMNEPDAALAYYDKIEKVYDLDMESARGWPLIKLKQYDQARVSARQVLETSTHPGQRARAWNTLCAADLASLAPPESMIACDMGVDDGGESGPVSIVDLVNASEVALSLLRMSQAEDYLRRASRLRDPRSVSNPWISRLYMMMNQSRFSEARMALDGMMAWRQSQEAIVSVMNRAEHYLVAAAFMLLSGYADDAAKLTSTALNQPDRTGSYSADHRHKDAYAALMNRAANLSRYQTALEEAATLSRPAALAARLKAQRYRLEAWRTGRRAAALLADFETLQNRLRPYAPLDVHIPEWLEPDIISVVGTGVMRNVLEQALANGAFQLNDGYYHAYLTEIAALDGDHRLTLRAGANALSRLPPEEMLLRARLHVRMAVARSRLGDEATVEFGSGAEALANAAAFTAAEHYAYALARDPSVMRRLALSLPVRVATDGSAFSEQVAGYLLRSPRFHRVSGSASAMRLEIKSGAVLSVCLSTAYGEVLSCHQTTGDGDRDSRWNAQNLSLEFQSLSFGLGFDISKAQRSALLGSSVVLSSQLNAESRNREAEFLSR